MRQRQCESKILRDRIELIETLGNKISVRGPQRRGANFARGVVKMTDEHPVPPCFGWGAQESEMCDAPGGYGGRSREAGGPIKRASHGRPLAKAGDGGLNWNDRAPDSLKGLADG